MYNESIKTMYIPPSEFTLDGLDFSTLSLLPFEDERLGTPPPLFDFAKDGQHAEALANGMIERMSTLGGVGIAANQLGLPYRVFVFGTKEMPQHIFNPKIVGVSPEKVAMEEGCLSLPGFSLIIKRASEVVASYQDMRGEEVVSRFIGLGARIFQHEYDHMEGLRFTQYASNFKMQWELKKLKKRIRRYEQSKISSQRER